MAHLTMLVFLLPTHGNFGQYARIFLFLQNCLLKNGIEDMQTTCK